MKNILITGCSSGIGYDTAMYLHKHGYKVYASARKDEDVKKLQNEGLDAYKLDVTSKDDVKRVLDVILKKDKKLYAIFNNAGFGQAGALEDISVDALKEQFETNVFGLHLLTKECIKIMRKQGYGRILQHSSVLGLVSLRFRGAYNASKYAIEGLSDTLRLELMGTNIYVCTINTGPITSDFRKNAIKMFKKNVTIKGSVFEKEYEEQLVDAQSKKEGDIFTKTSEVVIRNILDALEAKKPKPRYYNTPLTHIMGALKRLLPTSLLDKVLVKG
jgi:short-subunit dehydrogenase